MTHGYIITVTMAAGFVAAVARGADTNAAAAAAASPSAALGFSGCGVEVAGVYTQAELRVAVLDGVAGRTAARDATAVPEPDIDRSRGGGASPMASLAPQPQAVQPLADADAGVAGNEPANRMPGRDGLLSRGSGLGPAPARWGWLAESMRQNRERQDAERSSRTGTFFPRSGDPFSPDASVLFGGRLDGSSLLPGDTLTPLAPLAPNPYRSDASRDGMAP